VPVPKLLRHQVGEDLVTEHQQIVLPAYRHDAGHLGLAPGPAGGVVGIADDAYFALLGPLGEGGEVEIKAGGAAFAGVVEGTVHEPPAEFSDQHFVVVPDGGEDKHAVSRLREVLYCNVEHVDD
jgi:hypothetical protein